jgi:hypothetical protein
MRVYRSDHPASTKAATRADSHPHYQVEDIGHFGSSTHVRRLTDCPEPAHNYGWAILPENICGKGFVGQGFWEALSHSNS